MTKDSIENVQHQNTKNVSVEAPPLAAEDLSSREAPTTDIAAEKKSENSIDTDQTKPPDDINTAEGTRKVRKPTQTSKGRKTNKSAASTTDQDSVATTTTSRVRKASRTTKASPTLVTENEAESAPPSATQDEESAKPVVPTQNGEAKKTTGTKASRTRKGSRSVKAVSTPVIAEEGVTNQTSPAEDTIPDPAVAADQMLAQDNADLPPVESQGVSDEQALQTTQTDPISANPIAFTDQTMAQDNAELPPVDAQALSDEQALQAEQTDPISTEHQPTNNDPLEPTIVVEPINTGAIVGGVAANSAVPAFVEASHDQHSEEHTLSEPAEELQQAEIIASVASELSEEPPQDEQQSTEDAEHAEKQQSHERRELVRSASLVSIGNFGSSILGMLRQTFIASTGAAISGPFLAAISPAQKFNDFIINGSVPGALIPTFNDYAAPEKREELRRLVFTLVNLVFLIMASVSILFFFVAPWLVDHVLATKFNTEEQVLTLHFAQIIFLSLLALGPFAVLQAALFARKEFGWPAFATGAYHVGIIIGATLTVVVGSRFVGARYGIAFGVILGAIGQIALLLRGLFKQRLSYMFVLDLKQPAIRRILRLYGPIAFSFFVSACAAFLDQSLATQTPCMDVMAKLHLTKCGDANFSAMQFATTLIQFPGGLVASALSFAVLPTLTTHIREGNIERFKSTLLLGFRLGLLLMIPAAAGLIVLQLPIISLLFKHGNFTSAQSVITATALQNYAYQLPFVAIDQLLIMAFYARKNTIIPVAIGVVGVFGYLAVALPLWQTVGMPALALANAAQNSLHAIILLVIMRKVVGPMHLGRLVPTIGKLLLAAAIMIAVAWGLQVLFAPIPLFSLTSFIGRLLTVLIVGVISGVVYFGLVILLKVEEVTMLRGAVMAKLGKR